MEPSNADVQNPSENDARLKDGERARFEADRDRLLTAVEQAGDAIVITDPDGTIQYVNPAFERVSGYARAEAIGRNPRLLKSGLQSRAFYGELWETISAGRTWKGSLMNRRKDGTFFTEEATISPVIGPSGRIVNHVAVKHDITERLRLEAQFLQAQKMESVGRLAGGVAHDFNNMLSVITGLAELELASLDPGDPARSSLEKILKAGRRSADLTRQLLAFARQQTVAPTVLDLNASVAGVLSVLQRLIGEDIRLGWLPQEGLWPVRIDPSQIDQILVNLCVNARDAISGAGTLAIETENAVVAAAGGREGVAPGDYALLRVRDDGCGMDQLTLAQIFEPFFTTKSRGEGTGLGLATVYGIVKQNNGYIDVASAPGRGTTFTLLLPRHAEKTAATSPSTGHKAATQGHATVLLVEDEPSVLEMTKKMLEFLGYTVEAAKSPEVAINLALSQGDHIDVLLTDVVMPGMNGQALAGHLKNLRPNLKRVYMSGHAADVISHQGVLDEGVQFLQKPFSLDDLAAKLKAALESDEG